MSIVNKYEPLIFFNKPLQRKLNIKINKVSIEPKGFLDKVSIEPKDFLDKVSIEPKDFLDKVTIKENYFLQQESADFEKIKKIIDKENVIEFKKLFETFTKKKIINDTFNYLLETSIKNIKVEIKVYHMLKIILQKAEELEQINDYKTIYKRLKRKKFVNMSKLLKHTKEFTELNKSLSEKMVYIGRSGKLRKIYKKTKTKQKFCELFLKELNIIVRAYADVGGKFTRLLIKDYKAPKLDLEECENEMLRRLTQIIDFFGIILLWKIKIKIIDIDSFLTMDYKMKVDYFKHVCNILQSFFREFEILCQSYLGKKNELEELLKCTYKNNKIDNNDILNNVINGFIGILLGTSYFADEKIEF
jgi:hypothetical protein